MMYRVYLLHDEVAGEYAVPLYCKNDDVARRIVLQALKNYDDYEGLKLYYVGDFDSETGVFYFDGRKEVNLACISDEKACSERGCIDG